MEQICLVILTFSISYTRTLPAGNFSVSSRADLSLSGYKDFNNLASQKFNLLNNLKPIGVEGFPDSGRKSAVIEQESLLSQKDSSYGYLQQFVADITHAKPIIDTIAEHEKYGNDGDHFRSIGTALVGGLEGISNFLNGIVELPFQLMKQITRKASSTLNSIGGKLVGL